MKAIIILLVVISISYDLNAQSRKKIRELGIESITEVKVDYEDSNGKEIMRFVTIYDARGNVIKEVDYDNTGDLTEIITYEYNIDNDKTKEVHYKPNNKVLKTLTYSYVNGLVTERKEYDESNRLIVKNTYKYENGLVTERDEYDESNRLISKKKYIYKFRDE